MQRVIGYIPLGSDVAGFGIPVFSGQLQDSNLSIQSIDELTGRVGSFLKLQDRDARIVHLQGPSASIGDKQIYVFVLAPANVQIGTLQSIGPVLKSYLKSENSDPSTILQIQELIGTNYEKKIARIKMRKALLNDYGPATARSFYEGSVLKAVLWDRLLAAASNEEMAKRILKNRGKLNAEINSEGSIKLDISALTQEDLKVINVEDIINGITLEFDTQPARAELELLSNGTADHDFAKVQEQVSTLLREIKTTGRQEERISLLLRSILEDQVLGLTAVIQYQNDRANLANWVLNEIRSSLLNSYKDSRSVEIFIAALVPKLFTKHFTLSRGELLFYLAKHLADWQRINDAIQKTLDRTRSIFVNNWRPEIQGLLHDARINR